MKSDKLPPVMSLSGYLHCGLHQKNVDVYAALQVRGKFSFWSQTSL